MCFHTPKATSAAHRGGSTYFRPLLSLTALLCLTQLLLYTPQSALCQDVVTPKSIVRAISINVRDISFPRNIRYGLGAGFMASLFSHRFTVADGVVLNITKKESDFSAVKNDLQEALSDSSHFLFVMGPMGDDALLEVLPVLKAHGAVSFAPTTASSVVRGWNPNLYFTRPSPSAELFALLRYAVNNLWVHRLGFMYLQNVSYGEDEYKLMKDTIAAMGQNISGVFTVKSMHRGSADGAVFNAAWEAFADTRPQAVIVFGSPIKDTAKFIMRMLTDKRTAGAYLLGPTAVQDMLLSVWREAVNKGVPFVSGQVITTGTNPLAKDTQYVAIKRFQKVMEAYLTAFGHEVFQGPKHFLNNDNDGEMMVAGWMAGEVLVQAMGSREWLKDRKSFAASLFNQRRYIIDDLVIGDYGGECAGGAAIYGATCRCNQGGRTVYLKRFIQGYRAESIVNGRMTFRWTDCYASSVYIPPALSVTILLLTDSVMSSHSSMELNAGFLGAVSLHVGWWKKGDISMKPISTTQDGARDILVNTMRERRMHAVAGIVTEAMLDVPNVTFIDPLFLQPRLNKFRRHVIHLSPTVEQELFVLAQYLGSTTGATAAAVIRCDEAAAVEDVLRRSLVTFGGSLESAALLAGGDSLAGRLPSSGAVFVVGLADGDAALIAGHLTKHSGVRVFVLFSELSLRYAEFTAAFDGSGSADRLVCWK
ncbi:Leucine-binding protein domain [Trypanosoma melophagium]|uniref:Leucine-binding protein domain n=1 Tax=Trypanosoma melophagium TaxID=715481 RepID=UPI00351A718E|nr:Leucine-binding protein domain [Trypanosoma melophagium]